MFSRHKKQQIIFMRRRFARDKTQSTQGLTIPFDWKCLTRYSSSLVKITICSVFSISEVAKNTLVEILTARYRSNFHKKIKGAFASQTDGELIDFQ